MTESTRRLQRSDFVDRLAAAEILGVHPNTIDRMGKSGGPLRRYRIRGVRGVLFLRTDVESCIEPIPDEEDARG